MYAIFQSGSKQYRVEEGSKVRVERLELDEGTEFKSDQVLLVQTAEQTLVGTPWVAGAAVSGRVLNHAKADKVLIFKKKKTKQYRRTQGHRQSYSEIEIQKILIP